MELDFNKDVWKGIFLGLDLLILIIGIMGFFVDINLGKSYPDYTVNSDSTFTLGKTESISGEEQAEYTFYTGDFTQNCLNNVSIKSAIPSVGDINGGVLCRNQEISVGNWKVYIKDVKQERNEATITKKRLYNIPIIMLWLIFVIILIFNLLVYGVYRLIKWINSIGEAQKKKRR